MQAILIDEPGGPEKLVVRKVPRPEPSENEVLIRVAAAGVNRADLYQRRGQYSPPPGASPILGLEVSGTIEALGPSVTGFAKGDRVMALLTGGGYAQYVCARAETTLKIPPNIDFIQAAAVPEAYFTVWSTVFEIGRLKTGEAFLIHGGSSGIGSVAIPLARYFGASVFTTAGSREKCKACIGFGAHHAINYKEEDFVEVVRRETHGAGVDVILDMIGGDYLPRNISILKRGGRLVHINSAHAGLAELDLRAVIRRNLTVTGAVLRPRPVAEKAALAAEIRERLLPLLESGVMKPHIGSTFPLGEAGRAHLALEEGRNIGKVVLNIP